MQAIRNGKGKLICPLSEFILPLVLASATRQRKVPDFNGEFGGKMQEVNKFG